MTYDEWFKSLNQDGRTTYFLGQEGVISKEAWDCQQEKIDKLQCILTEIEIIINDDGYMYETMIERITELLNE